MDAQFWLERWEENKIGFHEGEANAFLVKYVDRLGVAAGGRIFLPLCGKTRDIAWLLSRGYHVTGAELSPLAIEQLFTELGTEPSRSESGSLTRWSSDGIDIFVGDLFDLSGEVLGAVDAIYDRAALVALPDQMRKRYTAHLTEISSAAPQLLITFDYDQALMDGPPFSVSGKEVEHLYRDRYSITLLESREVAGGLKGQCPATENAWLLSPTA